MDLIVNSAGDADAARLGEAFQPRRDVDSVTVNLLALPHHVAEVDADSEFHPAFGRTSEFSPLSLVWISTAHCTASTLANSGQYAIARRVNEAPTVMSDKAVDQFAVGGKGA
jgi:hypothetical protein